MRPNVHAFVATICLIMLVAGCGGGGHAPTAPEPTTTTLTLDFKYIEVLDDCDDFEGDGDFQFLVEVTRTDPLRTDRVYEAGINLGSGTSTPAIGRRSFTFDATKAWIVGVVFTASELDRSIFGVVYNDSRLDETKGAGGHNFVGGAWSGLGAQSLLLGSAEVGQIGCRVKLHWTATAA